MNILERLILSFFIISPLVEPHRTSRDLLSFHSGQDENGFINWEERCSKMGGKRALEAWLSAQEELVFCIMQNFDFEEIQRATSLSKSTTTTTNNNSPRQNSNNEVFVKYCGAPMSRSLPCVQRFLSVSAQCLNDRDVGSLNVSMSMITAAVKFLCHKKASRISSFIRSNGMECLSSHLGSISSCINDSYPEVLLMNNQKRFDLIVFNHRNCRQLDTIRHCMEKEMFKCSSPEPLHLLESFMSTLRRNSHCHRVSKYSLLSRGSHGTKVLSFMYLLPSLLLILPLWRP